MDNNALSLEHSFGKENETSNQLLFVYFCNNIQLGQWQSAKALLKQLETNKLNLKFDLSSVLQDIIENPEQKCIGSETLNSSYHLALLLYDYSIKNNYLNRSDIAASSTTFGDVANTNDNNEADDTKFYDKLIFKYLLFSSFVNVLSVEKSNNELTDSITIQKQSSTTSNNNNNNSLIFETDTFENDSQMINAIGNSIGDDTKSQINFKIKNEIIDELVNLVKIDLNKSKATTTTTTTTNIKQKNKKNNNNDSFNSSSIKSNISDFISVSTSSDIISSQITPTPTRTPTTTTISSSFNSSQIHQNSNDYFELSDSTAQFIKTLFIIQPFKAKSLIEIIFKYNHLTIERSFLKCHLNAIEIIIDHIDNNQNDNNKTECLLLNNSNQTVIKTKLLTLLSCLSLYKTTTSINNDSVEIVENCFRKMCSKFRSLYSLDEYDEKILEIYSSLLQTTNDTKVTLNFIEIFRKINYEIEGEFMNNNYKKYPLLSLVEYYSFELARDDLLWKRLFLYCYIEKKVLIKSILNECLSLVVENRFDDLTKLLTINEFNNLKPLILLLAISKVKDSTSANKLLNSLLINQSSDALVYKLSNLFKTHLNFINWIQQLRP
jgi:hypothetical protein